MCRNKKKIIRAPMPLCSFETKRNGMERNGRNGTWNVERACTSLRAKTIPHIALVSGYRLIDD